MGARTKGANRPMRTLFLAAALTMTVHGQVQASERDVLLMLDASGSMWTKTGDNTRIGDVRAVVPAVLRKYERALDLGIVAFGHTRAATCGKYQRIMSIGPINASKVRRVLGGVNPIGAASTATSLVAGANLLKAGTRPATMILITDGPDTCRGDPCKTALLLAKTAPDLKIHVIGLAVNNDDKSRLSCVAGATGGEFFTASNRREMSRALTKLLSRAQQDLRTARATPQPNAVKDEKIVTGSVEGSSGPAPVPGAKPVAPGGAQKATQDKPDQAKPIAARGETARLDGTIRKEAIPRPAAPVFVVREEKSDTAKIKLSAQLTGALEPIRRPVDWTIYRIDPSEKTKWIQVARHKKARPVIALKPGEYVVRAAYGHATAAKIVKTKSDTLIDATFILNAGAMRILPSLVMLNAPPGRQARQWIYPVTENGRTDKPIATSTIPGEIMRFNAGRYRIVSKFGKANAIVETRVTIHPGMLTEIEINHKAGIARFQLTGADADKLLANANWRLSDTTGALVIETKGGAKPAAILAPGRYDLSAQIAGKTYRKGFEISAGQTKNIAVSIK